MEDADAPSASLAAHLLAPSIGVLTVAGLDISSGYGVDSFLGLRPPDPWNVECVRRFVDVLIQHQTVVYPAPDRRSLEPGALAVEDPYAFAAAKERKALLQPYAKTAEDIELTAGDVSALWDVFARWAKELENDRRVREWLQLHRDPSISRSRDHVRYIDKFWPVTGAEQLLNFLGIPESELRYVFDVFVRTVRYQLVLGDDTVFFPHPVRAAARVRSATAFDSQTWSWGGFFAEAMTAAVERRNLNWLLDHIEAVKVASRHVDGASWYELGRRPREEQQDVIIAVAAEARLPAYLKASVQTQAALFAGAVAAGSAYVGSDVNVMLSLLSLIAGTQVSREIPCSMTRWKGLRGYLQWPGLFPTKS